MQTVTDALNEVKDLYLEVIGNPAPEIHPQSYCAFPLGADPLETAFREVEHVKELSQQLLSVPQPIAWIPKAECLAAPDLFKVRIETAGVRREDLHVHALEGELVVNGERKLETHSTDRMLRPFLTELVWGRFERRFALPAESRVDEIKASYSDGILEIQIPLRAIAANEPKPVKLD